MNRAPAIVLLGVLCAACVLGQAADERPSPVFRAETALIEIEVRATGQAGKAVYDLEKADFTLTEEGREQEISTFEFIPPGFDRVGAGASALASTAGLEVPSRGAYAAREETHIYIASRVGPRQRMDTYRAIQSFIEENLRPGVLVSLDGLPFNSDKRSLLAMLDTILREGGKVGIPSLVDLATASMDEQIANITAFTGVTSPIYMSTSPSIAHTQRVHFERTMIEGYTGLVHQLGVYPGKKILVLFSRGLRFDAENASYLDQFASAATRARVTLHAVDVRGLVALPTADASQTSQSVETAGLTGMPWPILPELADKPFSENDLRFSQQGLMTLAEATGGKAVVNNNDIGVVFSNVNEELGEYYLLGYYPRDSREEGRFREIKVEVDRPGVKLSFRKGYFENEEFSKQSKSEKRRALERLLNSSSMPNEIPLRVGHDFFRGAATYSVGIESRFVPAKRTKKGFEVNLVVLAEAESVDADRVPFVDEQSVSLVFEPKEFQRMQADSAAMLQFPSALDLPPGRYRWKVIARDENSGKAGTYQSIVEVPDFSEVSSPSSLLLTGQMAKIDVREDSGQEDEGPSEIDVNQMRFYPQAEQEYRQGAVIYMIYDLYNVPPDLLGSPPGPRVFLLRGETKLESPPFRAYVVHPDKPGESLRYLASLDTSELEPGAYKLLVAAPNGRDAIAREFTLLRN